ncbi:MAG: cation:proton antiporter [Thermoplasmata archaeon]|nr:MAG: cation:proton antiporter [Thermoplasmata archaeon]
MELDYFYWLLLLLLFGRAIGEVFRRFGFQPLIGEVLAGLILGPALLGLIVITADDENPLDTLAYFSQFGILMLMLLAGLITDFESFAENKMYSIVIGASGVIVSFFVVFLPLYFLLSIDFVSSLFIAAVLSNTAIEICAALLIHSSNQRLKAVVIGASFVDDILAVFIIGVVSPFVFLEVVPEPTEIIWLAARVIIFLIVILMVATWLLEKLFDRLHKGTEEFKLMLTTTFILTFLFALAATWVGLHFVIGAYLAGLVIGKWGSKVGPMLRRRITWRKLVEDIDPPLRAIFGPIFFGYIGLSVSFIVWDGIDKGTVNFAEVFYLIVLLGILVFVGKILGCGLGARICKFGKNESLTIGFAMCGRGALELVLLSFGLEIGAIDEAQFTALVIVTLITIIFTPILYTLQEKRAEKRAQESTSDET